MDNKDTPAFPLPMFPGSSVQQTWPGITKREYFAAMAMQGYLASYAGSTADPKMETVAAKSVEYADALLAELSKP